jgi:sorbitol-specific phosphotransferase system component IIBC
MLWTLFTIIQLVGQVAALFDDDRRCIVQLVTNILPNVAFVRASMGSL